MGRSKRVWNALDIGLHYSWFIIALLITLSLVGHFGTTDPNWSQAVVWTSAVVTAVLFFVSIVLHEVMRPIDQLRTIQPDMPAIDALRLMGREDVNQLPVMSEGKFQGMVGRRHILQLLQARAELNLPATPTTAVPPTVSRAAAAPLS